MNKRRRISTRVRAALLNAHGGVCHLCFGLIQVGEAWERSHPIPLACGGVDDETNWAPAHKKCHRSHTSTVDAPMIAKVRRVGQKHSGSKQSTGAFHSRGFARHDREPKRLTKTCAGETSLARRIVTTGETE